MQVQIQAKVTPINVPVYELPELLCVETRAVSMQYAIENKLNLQDLQVISRSLANTMQIKYIPNDAAKPKVMLDHGTMTIDTDPPRRERLVQTDHKETKDMGVQCNWEEEDFQFESLPVIDSDECLKEEGKFLSYVSDHTSMFPNGMLECLSCGEVAAALQEHQNHMAIHYGPRALCHCCGKQIGHQRLMKQHLYECSARSRPKYAVGLKCPHVGCNFRTVSKRYLHAHIGQHLGVKYYRCVNCRRKFSTAEAFYVHCKMQARCRLAKFVNLSSTSAKLTRNTDLRQCSVCLKEFSNMRLCAQHKMKCLRWHHQRLKRLLFGAHKSTK